MSAAGSSCPSCGSDELDELVRVAGLPPLQNLFSTTREAALALAGGELELRYCPRCHFAFNPAPEPPSERRWADYDNTQTASAVYRRYLDELARALCQRFALGPGSRVLEPACGGGWLIARLRELSGAEIRGFDPSYRGGHGVDEFVERELLRAPQSPAFDLVVLRHVLELAEPLDELLEAAAGSLKPEGWLVVEITDLDQAMRRGSRALLSREYLRYFSLPALARLLAGAGLALVEAAPCFGGDYLRAYARPLPSPAKLASGGPSPALDRVDALIDAHERVLIWGVGGRAVSIMIQRGWGEDRVAAAVDVDPNKQGRFAPVTGQRILSPEQAREFAPDLVVVANALYLDEIRASLGRADCRFLTLDGALVEAEDRERDHDHG
jgi:SAM-dependent methyltransferase